ncbi:MAG: NAD(P)-dependent oxidoreductase [Prevotella sp.]|nr:NAD(P)-dependent oxidoreductase [Bacteroides sp.]MCM1366874.1 NAD(P)-dependent oxidoreductase [Prevotella sp.]
MESLSTSLSHDNKKTNIFITGGTGTMGMATLKEFASRNNLSTIISVLARPTKKNKKKLMQFSCLPNFKIIWGDMLDAHLIEKCISNTDYIIHLGGIVSPAADYYPQKTLYTNVRSSQILADAVIKSGKNDKIKLVYIGSVAQYGGYFPPNHWGNTGIPCKPAKIDAYAVSKIEAERAIVDSGVKNWVSLRQTGILSSDILKKGADPITFHVPLAGVLEWVTVEDSARLIVNLCTQELPTSFWNKFYNIGGGERYRKTNYEFMCLLLKSLHCPPPQKIFNPEWFALQNFHGIWYNDSDSLNEILHFREDISIEEYLENLSETLPFYFKLAKIVPPFIIKFAMKQIAKKSPLGTLSWFKNNDKIRIDAFFSSRERWKHIPQWPELSNHLQYTGQRKTNNPSGIKYANDLSIINPDSEIDNSKLYEWECPKGHRFKSSPNLIYNGGHRCPVCLRESLEKTIL